MKLYFIMWVAISLFFMAMSIPVKAGVLGLSDKTGDGLQLTTTALFIADWGTTMDIRRHDDIIELNPAIGPYPSRSAINRFYIRKFIVHYAINRYLPEYRNLWNIWQIGITYNAVENNIRLGLRVKF